MEYYLIFSLLFVFGISLHTDVPWWAYLFCWALPPIYLGYAVAKYNTGSPRFKDEEE